MEVKNIKTTYVQYLEDAIETLLGVEPTDKSSWDEAILRAVRNLNEIKCYLKWDE